MLLATLPPSVLALVTRFIELEDVVKIGLLSGAGQLWHRMTVLGGVTELLISTKTSARFYLSYYNTLARFPHLTHLVITYKERMVFPGGWTQSLPRTLTNIEPSGRGQLLLKTMLPSEFVHRSKEMCLWLCEITFQIFDRSTLKPWTRQIGRVQCWTLTVKQ